MDCPHAGPFSNNTQGMPRGCHELPVEESQHPPLAYLLWEVASWEAEFVLSVASLRISQN